MSTGHTNVNVLSQIEFPPCLKATNTVVTLTSIGTFTAGTDVFEGTTTATFSTPNDYWFSPAGTFSNAMCTTPGLVAGTLSVTKVSGTGTVTCDSSSGGATYNRVNTNAEITTATGSASCTVGTTTADTVLTFAGSQHPCLSDFGVPNCDLAPESEWVGTDTQSDQAPVDDPPCSKTMVDTPAGYTTTGSCIRHDVDGEGSNGSDGLTMEEMTLYALQASPGEAPSEPSGSISASGSCSPTRACIQLDPGGCIPADASCTNTRLQWGRQWGIDLCDSGIVTHHPVPCTDSTREWYRIIYGQEKRLRYEPSAHNPQWLELRPPVARGRCLHGQRRPAV